VRRNTRVQSEKFLKSSQNTLFLLKILFTLCLPIFSLIESIDKLIDSIHLFSFQSRIIVKDNYYIFLHFYIYIQKCKNENKRSKREKLEKQEANHIVTVSAHLIPVLNSYPYLLLLFYRTFVLQTLTLMPPLLFLFL